MVQLVLGQQQSELLEPLAQGMSAGVLAQHEPAALGANGGRRHDLVRARVLEHAILLDAALVREGVRPYDGFVGLDRDTRELLEQRAGRHKLVKLDTVLDPILIAADGEGHDDLFKGGVAGALADAVHAALDLARASPDRGEAVGHGQTEIVVAVN